MLARWKTYNGLRVIYHRDGVMLPYHCSLHIILLAGAAYRYITLSSSKFKFCKYRKQNEEEAKNNASYTYFYFLL